MIAALFVEKNGCYYGLDDVDPWDQARDARLYAGPWPVVAHPPCERWGRFWHGSTRKPHQFSKGDDGGCFKAALDAVRKHGGVLEHPAHSHAWTWFGIARPSHDVPGWLRCDEYGHTCYVEQGFYGHFSRKPTWLYAVGCDLPQLRWGRGEQRLHPTALAKHGYEKARRIGMVAMIGGKDKKKIRDRTPIEFRDLLISIAQSVYHSARPRAGASASSPAASGMPESLSPGSPALIPEPAQRCAAGVSSQSLSAEASQLAHVQRIRELQAELEAMG